MSSLSTPGTSSNESSPSSARPSTRSREPSNTSLHSQDGTTSSRPSTASSSPRSNSFTSRAPAPFTIPSQLGKPGVEMLKVSAKSGRRVKPRKVWLELGHETPEDGEIGLEVGVGVVGGQDVKLCWEKNGRGLGFTRSENFASVPLSRIRDLRFASAGSPYRTSLHLPPSVEPRWITIIYSIPGSSSASAFKLGGGPAYKLVHFVANSVQDAELWRRTLEKFKEGRVAKAVLSSSTGDEANPDTVQGSREEEHKVVREEEVLSLCSRLGMGMSKAEISEAFKQSAAPNDYLDFKAFQLFVQLLKRRIDVEEIFRSLVGPNETGFTQVAWGSFLRDSQGMELAEDEVSKSFSKYADLDTQLITLEGFGCYLMSSDNAAIKDESMQDMTRPLPEYFISSSHNTYLIGSQFQGQSTVEGYIRALQQGCRCVELDVWDGDDGTPIITHGLTLTSKIPARTVLQAIAQYAFLASPYPVILSVEVHCEVDQQDKLAEIMKETLGDRLVSQRLDEMEGEVEKLPSPMDLRGRFLLKAKNKFVTSSNSNGFPIKMMPSGDDSESTEHSSQSSSDSDFRQSKFYRATRIFRSSSSSDSDAHRSPLPSPNRPSFRSSSSSSSNRIPQFLAPVPASNTVTGSELAVSPPSYSPISRPPLSTSSSTATLPSNPKDIAMSSSLASLLVYTVGVKLRGFNKKETYAPTHVISVGENRLAKMLKDEGARQDFISHNRGHLTRAYPKGSRVSSTNFVPHHMWAAGVQLVALNWQTFDVGMELNSAMFARANRSGYVLKPDLLRRKGLEKDKVAMLRSEEYTLEVEVISAQQLPRPRGSSSDGDPISVDPFVEVSLYVPGSVLPQKRRTSVVLGNAFNPVFRSSTASSVNSATHASTFTFTYSSHPSPGMDGLVFLRFEVLNARGNVRSAMEEGKGDSLGAYVISVGALRQGYRHVPLYDSMGDQHLFSTLFLRSRVKPTTS
ncbi:phosphatidylinositol phospholipase C [Sporobolomyces salmoneus]|uniref:phosphatidylinositol phospholipase C n=1 Tax=Sporobolomyces salmoneus TaxID=183962 RepID=UPI00316CEDE9